MFLVSNTVSHQKWLGKGRNMSHLSHLAINEEGFVFNPMSGDSFQVSTSGLVILKAIRDGKGDEDIVREIVRDYEVSAEEARHDVADFKASLKTLGLV